MGRILFEIREENLDTGLRGYPCGTCTTSEVDPIKGVSYAGIPIAQVALWKPVEVIFLLFFGKKGNEKEVLAFEADLKEREPLSKQVVEAIRSLPREMEPMHLLCTALLLLGTFEGRKNYKEDALNLIANVKELGFVCMEHHAGKKLHLDPKIGHLFHILHMDHDGGNLSTFVGKAVASGLEDLYGATCAAMAALHGPRHGRASQDSLKFFESMAKEQDIEAAVRKKIAQGELIYGFGHAVLRAEDPRATLLYELAKKEYKDHPLVKTALCLREKVPIILKETGKISNPYPNVDAISGTLLTAAGFPYPEYFSVLFGMSRLIGISIQILHERLYARSGRGTPLVRPTYYYRDRHAI